MDRPAALLFDLDDTLISAYANRSAAWRAHLKDYGEALHPRDSAEVAEAIASAAAQFWSGPRATAQNRHDLRAVRRANVSNAFAHLGIDDTGLSIEIADRFTEKRRAGHRLYPETVPLLQTCRALGLKTGLVTNGGKDEQRAKLSRFRSWRALRLRHDLRRSGDRKARPRDLPSCAFCPRGRGDSGLDGW